MTEGRLLALVADHNDARFELLRSILADEFLLEVDRARTWDELKGSKRTRLIPGAPESMHCRIVFFAEDLPYSYMNKRVWLDHYLGALNEDFFGIPSCCVVAAEATPATQASNPQVWCLPVPSAAASTADRDEIITRIADHGFRWVGRPPMLSIRPSPGLNEQIRVLSRNHNLDEGKEILKDLIQHLADCQDVVIERLGQGLSGAKVFLAHLGGRPVGERTWVLKLYSDEDRWKIESEVERHQDVLIGDGRYRKHIPELVTPRLPHDSGRPFVKTMLGLGWYTVAYDFLGRFKGVMDLETALLADAAELRRRTENTRHPLTSDDPSIVRDYRVRFLGTVVDFLCRSWYMDGAARNNRALWSTADAPDKKYGSLPPYQLAARHKEFVLGFMDGHGGALGAHSFGNEWQTYRSRIESFVEKTQGSTEIVTLDQEVPVTVSRAHGDLNANNVMLWLEQEEHPLLIDFPAYQVEGHALQDLARLEVEVKFVLMDRQRQTSHADLPALDDTWSQMDLWRELEDHLLSDGWQAQKSKWEAGGYRDNVDLCLHLVQLIRTKAQEVQQQSLEQPPGLPFLSEYRAPLLYYTLCAIGWRTLSVFKRLLAVYSAQAMLEAYQR